ncbi:hypothetical protein PMIT1320_02089 [Prochlorococcus marinus str. MIT 1320]|nr:hypothetical protein PMIT1320_02089 [Prochlorococcus marinus str. MIT 1320]
MGPPWIPRQVDCRCRDGRGWLPDGRGESAEAQSAICCAMAMRERLVHMNRLWQSEGVEPLVNGIGIASGIVLAGGIGGRKLG